MICERCGKEMILGSNEAYSDVFDDGTGEVFFYSCPECSANCVFICKDHE